MRPLVGQRVADARHVLDRHGTCLTTASLPGDGWRTQHDALKWRIFEDAQEMGTRCLVEVYGLFAACMPQDGRAVAADMLPADGKNWRLPLDGPKEEELFEWHCTGERSTRRPIDDVLDFQKEV